MAGDPAVLTVVIGFPREQRRLRDFTGTLHRVLFQWPAAGWCIEDCLIFSFAEKCVHLHVYLYMQNDSGDQKEKKKVINEIQLFCHDINGGHFCVAKTDEFVLLAANVK